MIKLFLGIKLMKTLKRMFGVIDLTTGSPLKVLFMFSLPILITGLLINSLNLINILILKFTIGGEGVTAINQTNTINLIILNFAIGVCSGFEVVGGHHYGNKDFDRTKQAFHHSVFLFLIISGLLIILGVIILNPTLTLLRVDERYFRKAHDYYFIIILGLPIIILNQLMMAYLRVVGEYVYPVIIAVASSLVQILFIYLLTSNNLANLDTIGFGIATLIANGFGLVANYLYLVKRFPQLSLGKGFKVQKWITLDLLKQGLPLGLQWSVFFVGYFVFTRQINLFGPDAGHGMTVFSNMEAYSSLFFSTIAVSLLSYVSKNYGANQIGRIKAGVKWALFLNLGGFIIMFVIGYLLIPYAPDIFLNQATINQDVRFYSSVYLYIFYPSIILTSLLTVARATLQGLKKPLISFISGIAELVMRLLILLLLPYLVDPNYLTTHSRNAYIAISFSSAGAWFISALILSVSMLVALRDVSSHLNNKAKSVNQ